MEISQATQLDYLNIKTFVSHCLEEIFSSPATGLDDLADIKNNFEIFLIAKDGDKIIGTAGIKNQGDARVSRMYIDKLYRGKGIGKLLITKLFQYCEDKFNRIFLTTYNQMGSVGFYQNMGFSIFKQDEQIWMEKITSKKNLAINQV